MGLNLFENHFPIADILRVFFLNNTLVTLKTNIEANCHSIRTALQRKNISVTTNLGICHKAWFII